MVGGGPPVAGPACRPARGFTLVEILIVVILLGILAAIVIPQMGDASDQTRTTVLLSNLQALRAQVLLYRAHHEDTWPTAEIASQLTLPSDADGNTNAVAGPAYPFGPYLQSFPVNPVSGSSQVRACTAAGQGFTAPAADGGWWYHAVTGELRIDLTDAWVDATGQPLNQW